MQFVETESCYSSMIRKKNISMNATLAPLSVLASSRWSRLVDSIVQSGESVLQGGLGFTEYDKPY